MNENEFEHIWEVIEKNADSIDFQDEIHLESYQQGNTDVIIRSVKKLYNLAMQLPTNTTIQRKFYVLLMDMLTYATDVSSIIRENVHQFWEPMPPPNTLIPDININIGISVPDNAILRLVLPPLLSAKSRMAYNTYHDVKNALKDYFKIHPKPLLDKKRLILIYRKHAPMLTADYTCDNDNWEMKRVTNAIAETFFLTDDANTFSFFYTAKKDTKTFAEIILIEEEKVQENIHFFFE